MLKFFSSLSIFILFIVLSSCTPVKLPNQQKEITEEKIEINQKSLSKIKINNEKIIDKDTILENTFSNVALDENIIVLLSNESQKDFAKQFLNVLELATYKKNFNKVTFDIRFFETNEELNKIISNTKKKGKIYIGPIKSKHTKTINQHCNSEVLFFSFSSDPSLANNCVYLVNFFPKNELEELFRSLPKNSKVALLFAENNYGYAINLLIDEVANNSDSVLINRSSYKNDLSNVRDSIKELGKYELRKFELDRQKQILLTKNDDFSKQRLKKLLKFKTTNDYDFTHVLIADYGINLLQVAPLLPYYDIDPNIVQFMATGVIDDQNFFFEPSLQGAIFPGIPRHKRQALRLEYKEIYDSELLRVSTLPYDLIGLLNYAFSKDIKLNELYKLLNNSGIKFNGVDGKFYFKDNLIERDLEILKIFNGEAKLFN